MTDFPDRYKRSILKECERLHMYQTGAGDPVGDDERLEVLAWMLKRLDMWIPSSPRHERYDNAVRALLLATVIEQVDKS